MNKEINDMKEDFREDIMSVKSDIKALSKKDDENNKVILQKMEKVIEKIDSKYASKWTEKAWTWLFITVGGVIVVALLTSILK